VVTLRIAIQKSGRLTEASRALISECGIEVEPVGAQLVAPAYNFPLELLFLRDDDIPRYVGDGVVDVAIVGKNVLYESRSEARVIRELGFGRCRLAIAVPKGAPYSDVRSLQGLRIATSYPRILSEFLERNGVEAEIHELSGSVEIAPSIGLGQAICDLVSSGSTLISNGLVEVEPVLESQAVLVAAPALSPEKAAILNSLKARMDAVLRARRTKYITLNVRRDAVPEVVKLLPGLKSPSVLPLVDPEWCSLHTVVAEDDFWLLVEKLKGMGAQGILVLPIEKVIQ